MWDKNNLKPLYTSDGTILPNKRIWKETDFIPLADWNPITKEQILSGILDPLSSYSGTKTFAERAVWEFAAEHPDINITVCKYTGFRLGVESL